MQEWKGEVGAVGIGCGRVRARWDRIGAMAVCRAVEAPPTRGDMVAGTQWPGTANAHHGPFMADLRACGISATVPLGMKKPAKAETNAG